MFQFFIRYSLFFRRFVLHFAGYAFKFYLQFFRCTYLIFDSFFASFFFLFILLLTTFSRKQNFFRLQEDGFNRYTFFNMMLFFFHSLSLFTFSFTLYVFFFFLVCCCCSWYCIYPHRLLLKKSSCQNVKCFVYKVVTVNVYRSKTARKMLESNYIYYDNAMKAIAIHTIY